MFKLYMWAEDRVDVSVEDLVDDGEKQMRDFKYEYGRLRYMYTEDPPISVIFIFLLVKKKIYTSWRIEHTLHLY